MVAGVPENQLKSIARMAMTGNFLAEPAHGQLAHNATSGIFVTNPGINDWALFLAEHAWPGAMANVRATEKYGVTDKKNETAFNVARNSDLAYFDYMAQSPERGKQFASYMKNVLASEGTKVDHVVKGFDWEGLGEATVVDVSQILLDAWVLLGEETATCIFWLTVPITSRLGDPGATQPSPWQTRFRNSTSSSKTFPKPLQIAQDIWPIFRNRSALASHAKPTTSSSPNPSRMQMCSSCE